MKYKILSLIFIFTSLISLSQENEKESNSIKDQFEKIYRTSSSYQKYKVISKDRFTILKLNVLDSLKISKNIILKKENLLKKERESIVKIQTQLSNTKTDLDTATQKENSISLFGYQLNKTTYNLILLSLIIVLILFLVYFIYKYAKSNVLTKEAKENLEDVNYEFEKHKKKAIEREQKLRRQLQDEINKQRNV
ncbi:hypothetical protein [uncultured Polaribacter sp.]|uniref:hypothetical protein n=1 Tax=uncultured Polaribacter sp. TaxID=174711 RepID=UPI00263380DC|nr:hypothetical protein [uncultured Polaribacter sp.]